MKRLLLALITMLALTFIIVPTTSAATDVFKGPCSGAGATSAVCQGRSTSNPLVGPDGLLLKVTRIVGIIAGAAAVIVIIISGLRYILSAGDSTAAKTARNGLIYAVAGLFVIILAQAIIGFIITKL